MNERDQWPDEVKRVKDEMDFHAMMGHYGYAVFSLQDGHPITHDAYPSRGHARRFAEKHTNDQLLIGAITPDGWTYKEVNAAFKYERVLSLKGFRTPDHFETEVNSPLLDIPATDGDKRRMLQQLISGNPLPEQENLPGGLVPSAYRKGK